MKELRDCIETNDIYIACVDLIMLEMQINESCLDN